MAKLLLTVQFPAFRKSAFLSAWKIYLQNSTAMPNRTIRRWTLLFFIWTDSSVLYLDGTKIEANANKMTFVWTKATQKYLASAWKALIEICEKLNALLASNDMSERVSFLRKPDQSYLLEIYALFAQLEERAAIKIVTGKGHRKHPLQKLHDDFAQVSVRLLRYAVYEPIFWSSTL